MYYDTSVWVIQSFYSIIESTWPTDLETQTLISSNADTFIYILKTLVAIDS